jgi:hypothetical protein
MQPEITVATMLGYVRLRAPAVLALARFPKLCRLSAEAEALPEFQACLPTIEEIGGPPDEAAALARLWGQS